MQSPIEQIINQIDDEGRIVFQGTLMAGYSARQALYNAYGLDLQGNQVDTFPEYVHVVYDVFQDKRLCDLFINIPNSEIEEAFWETVEHEEY